MKVEVLVISKNLSHFIDWLNDDKKRVKILVYEQIIKVNYIFTCKRGKKTDNLSLIFNFYFCSNTFVVLLDTL